MADIVNTEPLSDRVLARIEERLRVHPEHTLASDAFTLIAEVRRLRAMNEALEEENARFLPLAIRHGLVPFVVEETTVVNPVIRPVRLAVEYQYDLPPGE